MKTLIEEHLFGKISAKEMCKILTNKHVFYWEGKLGLLLACSYLILLIRQICNAKS